jgi:hypothetical protein
MNDWGTHGGSRGSRKARLLVLWKPWNCGPCDTKGTFGMK